MLVVRTGEVIPVDGTVISTEAMIDTSLPPVAGALLQGLIDLAVILNALRALRESARARGLPIHPSAP